ncbi:MAG: class I SAM-dependent methyltransferase [Bacteroidetes bacterium]|nr:class I SAM-dependent methyltransferase [Bacteroidota bacterium]
MEQLHTCPVCESENLQQYLDSKDYFLSKERFKIDQCQNCQFRFTNPRPEETAAAKYYESPEYLSHNTEKKSLTSNLYSTIRRFTIRQKSSIVNRHAKGQNALDIGCGTGEFMHSLNLLGYQIQGVEPNQVARKQAQDKFKLSILSSFNAANYQTNQFDVVTMWHVLEHVYRLKETILGIRKILNENGTLIVALPNPDSLDAQIYGKHWAAYDLPRHIYHFGQKDVNRLFNELGFEMIKMLPMYFDSFYVSILSENYLHGKTNYFKAFYNGFRSNLKAFLKKSNYSSQIYILKPKKG